MIEAHARMADAVKANDLIAADGSNVPARVGLVYNLQAVTPKDPLKPRDLQAAKDISYLMNQMFLDGAIKGDIDLNFDGKPVHRADLGRADFLGINYYVRVVVEGLGSSLFPEQSPFMTARPRGGISRCRRHPSIPSRSPRAGMIPPASARCSTSRSSDMGSRW
jgi:beta-glucosidase/6-phospho-beta-glucosidase/beta-galactosidase